MKETLQQKVEELWLYITVNGTILLNSIKLFFDMLGFGITTGIIYSLYNVISYQLNIRTQQLSYNICGELDDGNNWFFAHLIIPEDELLTVNLVCSHTKIPIYRKEYKYNIGGIISLLSDVSDIDFIFEDNIMESVNEFIEAVNEIKESLAKHEEEEKKKASKKKSTKKKAKKSSKKTTKKATKKTTKKSAKKATK